MMVGPDQVKAVIALLVGAFTFGAYSTFQEARIRAVEDSVIRLERQIERVRDNYYKSLVIPVPNKQ